MSYDTVIAPRQVWRSRDYRDHGREVRVVQMVKMYGSRPEMTNYVEVKNVVTGRNTAVRDDVFRRRYEYVRTED